MLSHTCSVLHPLKKNNVTFLMKVARHDYYTRFIQDNSSDPKRFFKATDSLFRNNVSILPAHTDDLQLANHMGDFFVQKITRLRLSLSRVNCSLNDTPASSQFGSAVFTDFSELSEKLCSRTCFWL